MPEAVTSNITRPLLAASDFSDQFEDINHALNAFGVMLGATINDRLARPNMSGGVEFLLSLIRDISKTCMDWP